MCDTGVVMKQPTMDDHLTATRLLARFGANHLCNSPPGTAAGRRLAGDRAERISASWRIFRLRPVMKATIRSSIRFILAVGFCLVVTLIILTDPLCAAVLATGRRLRRPQAEKATAIVMTASTSPKNSP